jgi:L-amino acid N-acyltransferase YncA
VRIRDADPAADAAACAAIYAPFVNDTAISFEERPPDAAEMRRRMENLVHRYPWLVAEDDASVVGYAYGGPHRERAAYRWAADVTIYIGPGHQRQGLGRALYEALFQRLTAQGLRMACAGITLPNDASVALHERLGFRPVGVYRQIGWKFDRWHDVAWYQRALRTEGPDPPAEPGPPTTTEYDR